MSGLIMFLYWVGYGIGVGISVKRNNGGFSMLTILAGNLLIWPFIIGRAI